MPECWVGNGNILGNHWRLGRTVIVYTILQIVQKIREARYDEALHLRIVAGECNQIARTGDAQSLWCWNNNATC